MTCPLPCRFAAFVLPAFCMVGCGLPRDPEGTSERLASTHELRVGVSDSPPWTTATGAEPHGVEPQLVRQFASGIGARVLWTRGSETQLVHSLEEHRVDLVIGGFEKKTEWSSTAGVTQSFAQSADGKKHVFLAAPGENRFLLALDRFLTGHKRSQ